MEYRKDLADILLNGLPADERQQVMSSISRSDEEKLRSKRSSGAAGQMTDGADPDEDEADEDDDLALRPKVPEQG